MVFSIVAMVAFVGILLGLSYLVRTSDRRIDQMEAQREKDYLWYTIRG